LRRKLYPAAASKKVAGQTCYREPHPARGRRRELGSTFAITCDFRSEDGIVERAVAGIPMVVGCEMMARWRRWTWAVVGA